MFRQTICFQANHQLKFENTAQQHTTDYLPTIIEHASYLRSMALPTISTQWSNRTRTLEQRIVRQREQEARWRQQWELHSTYFRQQNVRSSKQAQWSSRQSYQQSMTAYNRERLKEEKRLNLEQRRERLRVLLQEERDQMETELRGLIPDSKAEQLEKVEGLKSARELRRKKLAEELMREHWKKNDPDLRQVESALHKDHVVSQWETQRSERKEQEEAEREEKKRFENEYERTRREAMERLKQAEEKKKAEEREWGEALRQQMEELKLREEEASCLKKEQEALVGQHWELERMEEERRRVEEVRRKTELGRFLTRQYRAQLKRRAQQVQEELEADRRILASLLDGEQEDRRLQSARKERAVADAAWMKRVIEEQLQVERQREAEFDILYREDAQRMWEKREMEWQKERTARERLMQEVLTGRQQQLESKMQKNRRAQEESLRRREELIQELERERETRRQEREVQEGQRTARMQEIKQQMEAQRRQQWEEERRREGEEAEAREAQSRHDDLVQQETQRMTQRGYQEKIHSRPRTAWT
ncbi:trichoplein keratin filament-binding protein isoform X1 [Conger conger]|uniref:trichoplein keratin filament-binding protein isoform X1 n=2 Tax=Conger conger TaxID=82655 RepID=UPI002A5A5BE3|nr:trichoplein keratin filament-binding protein isoform X1 [Conger conger]